jgi:hypothetical protein
MKKLFIVLGIIAIVVVVYVLDQQKQLVSEKAVFVTPATQCFKRSVAATPEAPYAVSERIQLVINGASVVGVKSGTQAGPDMTNGYEGILSGNKEGDFLELVYSYTIEGSEQKELERYELSRNLLIKHRYALMEQMGALLMPDLSKGYAEEIYHPTDCFEE